MPHVGKLEGVKEYKFRQSPHYPEVQKCPFRTCYVAGSTGGKTNLLVTQVTQHFRGVFSRIVLVSPSHGLDDTLQPIYKLMESLGQDVEEDCRDHYDDTWLTEKLSEQRRIVEYQKKHGATWLHQLLVLLDDVSDSGARIRQAGSGQGALSTLMCRSRHFGTSCILSLQKLFTAPPLLRCNFSDIVLLKLKVQRELSAALEEVSALLPDKQSLEAVYRKAVSVPYGFLWIALGRPDDDTFHIGFAKGVEISRLQNGETQEVGDGRGGPGGGAR
jgi:hypothetical protein